MSGTVERAAQVGSGVDAELFIDGKVYGGWTTLRITREIDKLATDFDATVTERWPMSFDAWRIPVFSPCELRLRGQLVLTGFVDAIFPAYDSRSTSVRVVGRSKTADLIDCSSELPNEFRSSTLPAIVRAVCAPFGIEVVVEADTGEAFPTTAMEVTESAFDFIERLCRMRGVLATDDAKGRIVLTRASEKLAEGALVEGENILAMQVEFNVSKRFSRYIFKAQTQTSAATSWAGAGEEGEGDEEDEAEPAGGGVQISVIGTADDPNVPRYRPRIFQAEQALTVAGAQERARWQASHAAGRSTKARVRVKGWHQPGGRLWQVNELVPCLSPWARLDQDLLIAGVTFLITAQGGRETELLLGPPGGFTPEPVKVKTPKKASGGGGADWLDVPLP